MRGAAQINELERISVQVLLDYLGHTKPGKVLADKAQVAKVAFASVQRRRSAENQREALRYMIRRDGLNAPTLPMPAIPAAASGGETSP